MAINKWQFWSLHFFNIFNFLNILNVYVARKKLFQLGVIIAMSADL